MSLPLAAASFHTEVAQHSQLICLASPRQLADSIIRFYYRLNRQSFRLMVLRRQLFVQQAVPGRDWPGPAGAAGPAGQSREQVDVDVTAMRLLRDVVRPGGQTGRGGQLGFTPGQSDLLRRPHVPPDRQTTVISPRFIALFFRLSYVRSFVYGAHLLADVLN